MSWKLNPNRCFSPLSEQRKLASELYQTIKDLPLICPHGHVMPELLSDPSATFGSPADLFVIPDHYVFRMLHSQGVALESLGIARQDGKATETDHRKIWQTFSEHFYLFQGTPTGLWLKNELIEVFGIKEKLNGATAQVIYDELEEKLDKPEFSPRALSKQFNIEVLCTTDGATDKLEPHRSLQNDNWHNILPTFRPDNVINLDTENWQDHINALSELSGITVGNYKTFIQALEERRSFFKTMGAVATDHGALDADTTPLSTQEAEIIFANALAGSIQANDAQRFTAHMLFEMARMSSEDGLVMQLHVGSYRNHNQTRYKEFGRDIGADIPVRTEWTKALAPLLDAYGNHPNFRLILFTLDESSYSRELAPLAGYYPALRLGPPWWFFDSAKGMERYFDAVVETAGIYNLAGFNDDTRAFASIPARHDVWRRVSSNWLAGETLKGMIDEEDAASMAHELAYGLAKKAYKLQ